MTQLGGRQWAQVWTALSTALASAIPSDEHLATEAVVAYVDGELSVTAHERATRHLAHCTLCTAEVAAQRQARAAVRSASAPEVPLSLLAALHAIPHSAELPPGPDGLAIGEDGQFLTAQRPLRDVPPLGLTAPIGSTSRLGSTGMGRRVVHGAGIVVSGLVLGALVLSVPGDPTVPGSPRPGAERSGTTPVEAPARLEIGQRADEDDDADVPEPSPVASLPQR